MSYYLEFISIFGTRGMKSSPGLHEKIYVHTVKFHFVTNKHVVMLFKLRISFQKLVFILKIIEQWLLFHNPAFPFENLVFEPS